MLPYFEEYSEKYNDSNFKVYEYRLRILDRCEQNVLELSAEEISEIINAKELKLATLNSFYSAYQHYLKWVNEEYNVPISECHYQLRRLRELASETCCDNLGETLFKNFSELKASLFQVEDEYVQMQELELSERKLDTLYQNQKKYNAYVVLLWNGMSDKEMLKLTLKEVLSIITSKQICINGKISNLSDDEIGILSEMYNFIEEQKNKDIEKEKVFDNKRKRKIPFWTYDNLFNTESMKSLSSFCFKALGVQSDIRLLRPGIKKAGIFNRMYQYEQKNDCVFYGKDGTNVCAELFSISDNKAARLINEYSRFRESIENSEK